MITLDATDALVLIEAEKRRRKMGLAVFVLPPKAPKPARGDAGDYVAPGQRVKKDTTQALKGALAAWRKTK